MSSPYDLRALVYGLLANDAELTALWQDRIYQRSGMLEEEPPTMTPFGVYYLDQENLRGPSALKAKGVTVQVWVHDDPGDYFRCDQILERVRLVLEGAPPQGPFLQFRQALKSPDLFDDLLKTIVKFGRFVATIAPEGEV